MFASLDLGHLADHCERTKDDRRNAIRQTLDKLETATPSSSEPDRVRANASLFGELVWLDETECDLLALATYANVLAPLRRCFESSDGPDLAWRLQDLARHNDPEPVEADVFAQRVSVLARVLGRAPTEIDRALRAEGSLHELGLLEWQERGPWFDLSVAARKALLMKLDSVDDLFGFYRAIWEIGRYGLNDYDEFPKEAMRVVELLCCIDRSVNDVYGAACARKPGATKQAVLSEFHRAGTARKLKIAVQILTLPDCPAKEDVVSSVFNTLERHEKIRIMRGLCARVGRGAVWRAIAEPLDREGWNGDFRVLRFVFTEGARELKDGALRVVAWRGRK